MRTLAIIPARLGATRLPRKPLRHLAGVPLVLRVWERVTALGVADDCVVATDSDEVAAACTDHGAPAVMTSSAHLSGTDRIAEVVTRAEYSAAAVILNVQGDEPFVSATALKGALEQVTSAGFDLGTVAAPATADALGNPNVVKVVTADDGRAMYFSRAPIPYLREATDAVLLAGRVWHHLGVYAYRRDALQRWVALKPHPLELIERLEQLRPLAAGLTMGVKLIDEAPRPGIDTEDDLARANSDWNAFTSGRL